MNKTYFQMPRITLARPLAFGAARFVDASTLAAEVAPALGRVPTTEPMTFAHDEVRATLAEWGRDAALEISGPDPARTDQIADEAMALLRFTTRPHIPVNVDAHRFGLVGEHAAGRRDRIVLFDQHPPLAAPGWKAIGGWPEFAFDEGLLSKIESDRIAAWLGPIIGTQPATRSDSERRALRAVTLLDRGFRSQDDDQRILLSSIAVEVLFSRSDRPTNESQVMAIARRIAYLSCGGGCGRFEPHCIYTETSKSQKALLADLKRLARRGKPWRCSAFLHIATPSDAADALRFPSLFAARNEVAHEGGVDWDASTVKHLVRVAERSVTSGSKWLAAHAGLSMADLDSEIGVLPI